MTLLSGDVLSAFAAAQIGAGLLLSPLCVTGVVFCGWWLVSLQNMDGRVDLVAANYNSNSVIWYANGGGSNPTWTAYTMSTTNTNGVNSIVIADST